PRPEEAYVRRLEKRRSRLATGPAARAVSREPDRGGGVGAAPSIALIGLLVGEDALRCSEAGHVVPARVRMLRRRAGVVVERPKTIGGTCTRVDAVHVVAASDRGLHRQHVVERALVGIEGWIGKAVRMSGFLVRQRHQAREDRAREAPPAGAGLVVLRALGGPLCL